MSGLLQIGEFALLTGVSVKTLRFYCDQGLLTPAHVDSQTGYRYFSRAQIAEVTRILNLREAEIGLCDIRTTLERDSETSAVIALLETQRAALIKERAAVESRLRIVEGLLSALDESGSGALSALRVVRIDPEFVYSATMQPNDCDQSISELFEHAERTVAAVGGRAKRSPFLLIRQPNKDGPTTVEACIPVTDRVVSELDAKLIHGESIACSLTYSGPYDQTAPLHRQLKEWLEQAGLEAAGPLREVYHRFGADQDGYTLPSRVLASSRKRYVTELLLAARVADPPPHH